MLRETARSPEVRSPRSGVSALPVPAPDDPAEQVDHEVKRMFTVTDDEVLERKWYLEITAADEERLKAAHPLIQARAGEIIERFYEYLLAHEHTRKSLSSPGLIERLKPLQLEYFFRLTSGDYGPAYFEDRIRLGQVHHRIGLSPEWYIGAYLKYLHIVSEVLRTAFGRDQERFFQTSLSLTKIIYLDMGLTLDAYHLSAQEALRDKAEELEAVNTRLLKLQAAKRLLADMVVHDLQNPLAGIHGFLQIMEQRLAGQPQNVRDALEEALRSCNYLAEMIFNVLQISRSESGQLEPVLEDLDLAELVKEVAEPYRMLFPGEGRELEVVASSPLPVRTDVQLLRRILQNLLRNTLRHTPRGTRVLVRTELLEPAHARLTVTDNGPGIAPELQEFLFQPLGAPQLRQAGLRVDSGLGLAFCKVACEALGASLSVESDGKSGTTFRITLPRHPDQEGKKAE